MTLQERMRMSRTMTMGKLIKEHSLQKNIVPPSRNTRKTRKTLQKLFLVPFRSAKKTLQKLLENNKFIISKPLVHKKLTNLCNKMTFMV